MNWMTSSVAAPSRTAEAVGPIVLRSDVRKESSRSMLSRMIRRVKRKRETDSSLDEYGMTKSSAHLQVRLADRRHESKAAQHAGSSIGLKYPCGLRCRHLS